LLFSVLAEALLFYDWLAHLPTERKLIWNAENKGALGWTFLWTRYLALSWATFVGVVWLSVAWNPQACAISRFFPQG
jgi:hypothetical protein